MSNRLGDGATPTTYRAIGDTATEPQARALAESLAQKASRSTRSMRLTMPGSTRWRAGAKVSLTNFRPGENGSYIIKLARNSINASGWTTELELEESGT